MRVLCVERRKQLLLANIASSVDEYSRLHSSVPSQSALIQPTVNEIISPRSLHRPAYQCTPTVCVCMCVGVSQIIKQFHIFLFCFSAQCHRAVVCCRGPSHYIRVPAHVHHFVEAASNLQWKMKRKEEKKWLDERGVNAMPWILLGLCDSQKEKTSRAKILPLMRYGCEEQHLRLTYIRATMGGGDGACAWHRHSCELL